MNVQSTFDLNYWLFRSEGSERRWIILQWSAAGLCWLLLWCVYFKHL